jgi:hypothetical protein
MLTLGKKHVSWFAQDRLWYTRLVPYSISLIGFDFGPVTTNISDYGGGGGVNPTKRLQGREWCVEGLDCEVQPPVNLGSRSEKEFGAGCRNSVVRSALLRLCEAPEGS